MAPDNQATAELAALVAGDGSAAERLMPLVYDELRRIAQSYLRRENAGHTLQATALVNEAFLKLVEQTRADWKSKAHFLAICAQAMRRILVDHARTRKRVKRGGGRGRVTVTDNLVLAPTSDVDVLDVEEALQKLAALNERHARIVELRFFAGLDVAEVAEVLGVSKRTVEGDWTLLKAWLRKELQPAVDA